MPAKLHVSESLASRLTNGLRITSGDFDARTRHLERNSTKRARDATFPTGRSDRRIGTVRESVETSRESGFLSPSRPYSASCLVLFCVSSSDARLLRDCIPCPFEVREGNACGFYGARKRTGGSTGCGERVKGNCLRIIRACFFPSPKDSIKTRDK